LYTIGYSKSLEEAPYLADPIGVHWRDEEIFRASGDGWQQRGDIDDSRSTATHACLMRKLSCSLAQERVETLKIN